MIMAHTALHPACKSAAHFAVDGVRTACFFKDKGLLDGNGIFSGPPGHWRSSVDIQEVSPSFAAQEAPVRSLGCNNRLSLAGTWNSFGFDRAKGTHTVGKNTAPSPNCCITCQLPGVCLGGQRQGIARSIRWPQKVWPGRFVPLRFKRVLLESLCGMGIPKMEMCQREWMSLLTAYVVMGVVVVGQTNARPDVEAGFRSPSRLA